MIRDRSGLAWRLLVTAVVEVLNPLLLISLALYVSFGYILTLLMPVTIDIWVALLWLTLIVTLLGLLYGARIKWKHASNDLMPFSAKALLPMVALLAVIPAFLGEFAHPTMQVTHHGDIHVAHIHQLLYEATPLENVFAAGYPAGYYWLYHALLASIVQITGFSPPSISSLINVIAVLGSFIWIGKTLQLLELGKPRTLRFGFMILLVYFSVNITSALSLASHVLNGTYTPYSYDIILLAGASPHLHSVLAKVMNFQSLTLGIMIFTAALYACVKLIRHGSQLSTLILISCSGVATLAVREIAALYIVVLLLGGILSLIVFEWFRARDKTQYCRSLVSDHTRSISPAMLLLWFVLSLALSLPLLHYNFEIFSVFSAGRPYGFSVTNIRMIIAALLLLLPLFALQVVRALQSGDRQQIYLQICCAIGLLLTTLLTLPDANQYKGVYFVAILMAISALMALRGMRASKSRFWRRIAGSISLLFYFLVLTQIAYVTANFWNKVNNYGDGGYRFVGTHVEHAGDVNGRLPAYLWIREHTSYDALVVLQLAPGKYSNLFHERMLYVRLLQLHFAASDLPYRERAAILDAIYSEDTSLEEYGHLLVRMQDELPDREFYAVVKDSEVSPNVMAQRGAKLVFEHESDGANVYLLNPEAMG